MTKKGKTRIYWRGDKAYGDFRDFADVGGRREALKPEGLRFPTTDPDMATELVTQRVRELELKRRNKVLLGVDIEERGLAAFAAYHLETKAREGEVTQRWLVEMERHLRAAVEYFGADRTLLSITSQQCSDYVQALLKRPGRRGSLTKATARKFLNSLSDMFSRALSESFVTVNPVAAMYSKPTPERRDPTWFKPAEAALILESARLYQPPVEDGSYPYVYPLVATWLLAGLRKGEALGLEVDDVSFKRGTITVRPNKWRRLKTASSERTIPLWPQLEKILRAYLIQREQDGGLNELLFPATRGGKNEHMIDNVRKSLDRIGARAGFEAGSLRATAFRHSYATTRLYTAEHGAPVSLWTVRGEMGHRSTSMIENVYGHTIDQRTRAWNEQKLTLPEVVEFRIEDHREDLAGRLLTLEAAS